MKTQSALTDTESELLNAFENAPTLEKLAKAVGRDMTVVSRQLTRIATKGDFLIKVGGRWKLTDLGREHNRLHRDFLFARSALLRQRRTLRIGTNREFASRVLAEDFARIRSAFGDAEISIVALDGGVESALLDGAIDIGIDCGRPYSPEITYRHETLERIVPVASPDFIQRHKLRADPSRLPAAPHVSCDRLAVDRVSHGRIRATGSVAARTNDIASARALCVAGTGWAILPRYAIARELAEKSLRPIGEHEYTENYGVWRLRSRKTLAADFERIGDWLRGKTL